MAISQVHANSESAIISTAIRSLRIDLKNGADAYLNCTGTIYVAYSTDLNDRIYTWASTAETCIAAAKEVAESQSLKLMLPLEGVDSC